MLNIKGVVPILQAPFTNEGALDYEDLYREVDAAILDGAGAVTLFGTGTEFYMLSDEEKRNMISVTLKAAKGRVPVIASVTRNSTYLAVQDAKLYKDLGVDALMNFPPHFEKPTPEMVKNHIMAVASATDLPFIVQYAPGVGGATLTPQDFQDIKACVKNELYIKVEPPMGAVQMIRSVHEMMGDDVQLLCGMGGTNLIGVYDAGGQGIMPGCAFVRPFTTVINLYNEGKREEAINIYLKMASMIEYETPVQGSYNECEKRILVERGIFKTAHCRYPNFRPDESYFETMHDLYNELKEMTDPGVCY